MSSLGLSVIVGKDEAFEFDRCLKSLSRGKSLFDEIVITMTFKDVAVEAVAKKYTDKIHFFAWIKDFAAARNFCLDKMTTDYVMWVDADDIVTATNFDKLLELKSKLCDHDVYMMTYNYFHDSEGRPVVVQPRERIFRRIKSLQWQGVVHETVILLAEHKIEQRRDIAIDHYRMKPHSGIRNIEILREQFRLCPNDARIHFYLGRDVLEEGLYGNKPELLEEGYTILEEFVSKSYGYEENRTVACIKLAQRYLWKQQYDIAKNYAMQGMTLSDKYAELYLILAEIYRASGNYDLAIQYNEEALTRNFDANFSQMPEQYKLKPAVNLALLYYWNKGDKEKSFEYNRLALQYVPHDTNLLYNQSVLFNQMSTKISAVWLVPCVNLQYATIRIRYHNIDQTLTKMGMQSTIVTNYYSSSIETLVEAMSNSTVFVFTRQSDFDLKLAAALKAKGKKVIIDICESIFYSTSDLNSLNVFDAISCCSTGLSNELTSYGVNRTRVIKDAIEDKPVVHNYKNEGKLKAVYCGMGGNSFLVTDVLRETIESAGYELVVLTEWDNATKKWDMNTWHEDMSTCDVALCPQRVDIQPSKSNVKVTTAMNLGLPVIASPILAYQEVVSHGDNGFLCNTKDEWYSALVELKDEQRRKEIGEAGKRSISNYSQTKICNDWISLFYDVLKNQSSTESVTATIKVRTTIDIIIISYNCLEYLKLCLNSILLNTDYPYHIIISDAGSSKETWDYFSVLKGFTILGSQNTRLNFSQACNAGILASRSKYFVILNLDVIVSKNWLTNLVEKIQTVPRLAACGVLSNCDRGWLHGVANKPEYPMKTANGTDLHPGMIKSQINVDDLNDFMKSSNDKFSGQFVEQEWVAAYATIFARCAINEVGLFDEEYKNGCEDRDLCLRLKKYQYTIGQAIDSFVFHFGGVARGAYQKEDTVLFRQEDVFNHNKMQKKWAKEKVVIYTGPAWEKWSKETVNTGMGGSETWAARLSEQLSLLGYDVTVYADLQDENATIVESTGEKYRHHTKLVDDFKYDCIDYLIASRTTDAFALPYLHAINKYVMIHDIWLSSNQNYNIHEWQVRNYFVLSNWHKSFVMSHHKIPENKILLTANGSDQQLYAQVDQVKKKNKIFYSSSPDRGLYELLQMFPKIRERVPDVELVVAYGFYNWERAIISRNSVDEVKSLNTIRSLLNQPGVRFVDRLSKSDLAKEQMECKAWLYPTVFWETFCITSVEAGLAKCAILSTKVAGLISTVGDAGILLDGDNKSSEYQSKFIDESVRLLTDEEYRLSWAEKAHNKMLQYRWDKIALDWQKVFKRDSKKVVRLNLGCGGKKKEGYTGVDIFRGVNIEQMFSIDSIPYVDKSVTAIYSEHVLEHLTFKGTEVAIKEFYRVLKDGGELHLKIPDLEQCCREYVNAKQPHARQWYKYTIYGIQESQAGEPDEAQIHKSGFSKDEIKTVLERHGFKVVYIERYDGFNTPSIEVKALK